MVILAKWTNADIQQAGKLQQMEIVSILKMTTQLLA